MCGIAGIMSFDGKPVSLEVLQGICAALVHRGPDDEGFCIGRDTSVGLGVSHLSTTDLQTGRQPVHNEDGAVWVVLVFLLLINVVNSWARLRLMICSTLLCGTFVAVCK
jgi:hypothetical protein